VTPEEFQLQIHLAEYAAMRNEILALMTMQATFVSFSVVLFSAAVALNAQILHGYALGIAGVHLVLGLLYCETTFKIWRVARYINLLLKPQLEGLSASGQVLEWDS
jgi:hypothetical protein